MTSSGNISLTHNHPSRTFAEIGQVEKRPDFDPRVKVEIQQAERQEDGRDGGAASSSVRMDKKQKKDEMEENDEGMFNLFAGKADSSAKPGDDGNKNLKGRYNIDDVGKTTSNSMPVPRLYRNLGVILG